MACFSLVMTYLPQARNPHKGAGDYALAAARSRMHEPAPLRRRMQESDSWVL